MDGRTALMILGVMLLVLLGWGGPMLAAVYCEKQEREKRGEPDSFDERQKLARQRAGNHALYVLVGFLAVWACADLGGWFPWTGSVLDLVLCALPLTWGVWTADCILHDAFTSWKEKNYTDTLSLSIGVIMMNFVTPFWTGGLLKSRAPWYLAFGIVVALGGVVLYKRLLLPRLKKGEEDEL